MACAIDDFEMGACLLLENGADINIHNNDGKCALTMATLHGNDAMISLLLANGANIAVQDRSGSNLLFSASDSAEALEALDRQYETRKKLISKWFIAFHVFYPYFQYYWTKK